MSCYARMLAVLIAATCLSSAAAPATSDASTALVRVETPQFASQFTTLVDRTVVTVGTAPTVKAAQSCAPDSAAAALSAAIGDTNWDATSLAPGTFQITQIKGVAPPLPASGNAPAWNWVAFVDQHYVADPCHALVPDGSEAVFFPACTDKNHPAGCFIGGPLYVRISDGTPYATSPVLVGGRGSPVSVSVIEAALKPNTAETLIGPSTDSTVATDEGVSATSNDNEHLGIAVVKFTEQGEHKIKATEAGKVPGRGVVCTTDGQDGFCGTPKPDFNPFDVGVFPSTCATNGHDGLCGTQDTSGPVAHILNITDKQVFKKGKGPGKLTGHLDVDPNGVKGVRLRLTRVATTRVRIKAKKKATKKARKSTVAAKAKAKPKVRYKTVKRCTAWDDGTALLESAKCGAKYGKWFDGDLSDLRYDFSYSFAMTMPAGTYLLEVEASDENGSKDPPVPGRNVITFTVL